MRGVMAGRGSWARAGVLHSRGGAIGAPAGAVSGAAGGLWVGLERSKLVVGTLREEGRLVFPEGWVGRAEPADMREEARVFDLYAASGGPPGRIDFSSGGRLPRSGGRSLPSRRTWRRRLGGLG